MKKTVSLLLVFALISQATGVACFAWEQPAHKVINEAAVKRFESSYAKSAKYKNAAINLNRMVDAPVVTSSGKFAITYNQRWSYLEAAQHIILGGFSADEPNVYVSVKHFYDPLALSGKHELTDQSSVHGMVYEAIPATEWATSREDNPYSLVNAMNNYRKSLQIASDSAVSPIAASSNFRDFAGTPADVEEMRNKYLGKAIRGLGEVMHLVADMTQPSHVRNDSHPLWEITEQVIVEDVARSLVQFGRTDGFSVNGAGSTVKDLMASLATWTNKSFYSADTIADIESGITPYNGEKSYSSPNLSTMTSITGKDGVKTWYSTFGGKKVPMFQVVPDWVYDNYEITKEFAIAQAEVLLPLAVSSTAKAMDLFFPTLVSTQKLTEETPDAALLDEAKKAGAEELKQYQMEGAITHKIESDPQWKAIGSAIQYSGPGEIWRIRGSSNKKLCSVEYINGTIAKYQDPDTGEMTDGQPTFYLPLGAEKKVSLGGAAIDYTVELDDAIYTVTYPGLQTVQSESYVFEQEDTEIILTADRTTIMPGEKVAFTAEIKNAPERYKLEWTFGDEEDEEGKIIPATLNRKLEMKHTYKKEKEYTATVRLIDLKRNIVRAEDTVAISTNLGELGGAWGLTMEVEEENKFFKSFIVAIMKGLIQFIISPIAEALGGDPIDPSAVDNFTFVGTTLEYTLDLKKTDETGTIYQGPLTFVGSNTGYLEGNGDIRELRLEIKDGEFVFTAIGVNEQGSPVEYVFLKNGKMVSPTQIEGDYDLTGFMSGKWTAVKK